MPAVKPVTFKVEGLREVMDALEQLPGRVAKNVVRRSLYAGAVVVRDEARRRAAVRYGALSKAIIARTNRRQLPTLFFGEVTISRQAYIINEKGKLKRAPKDPRGRKYVRGQIYPKNYAHLVEFGTSPHIIRAKRGKLLATPYGLFPSVRHPGARPRPFMRTAYAAKAHESVEAIRQAALDGIEKETTKLRGEKGGKGK